MFFIKSIIVPVDFSPCSINALQYAAAIASKFNASVRLLYVNNKSTGTVVNGRKVEAEDALKELRSAAYFANIKTQSTVSQGSVAKEILTTQTGFNADLIVMGTLGANKVNRKLFGTNTANVIQNAHCPVWAVPEGKSFTSINKIAFATDMKNSNLELANEFTEIAGKLESEIQFLHVDIEGHYKKETVYKLDQAMKKIREFVDFKKITMHLSTHHKVTEGINSFVRKNKPDLLVMVNHKRNLLQSIYETSQTREIVNYTNTPLLALPLV